MGLMGTDPIPAEAEALQRERAERKQREQREQQDEQKRADMILSGRERPENEFLGLGVVVRDGEVLVWSTTIVQVLGPLAGAQAGITDAVKTRGGGAAVAATVAF